MYHKTRTYDVVVVGGGIAGISAALSSARQGAKTALVESSYVLGGLAVSGLVSFYLALCDGKGHKLCHGIAEELLKLSVIHGSPGEIPTAWFNGGTEEEKTSRRYEVQFDPHIFAIETEKLLIKSGVKIFYGCMMTGVKNNKQNDRINYINVSARSDSYRFYSKSFIDATGDANLCFFAGEKTAQPTHGNAMSAWYHEFKDGEYKIIMEGSCDHIYTDGKSYKGYSCLNAEELSKFTANSHNLTLKSFLKKGGVSKTHSITTLPTIPQVRMTRRLIGETEMNYGDDKKRVEDSVGLFGYWLKAGPAFELPLGAIHGENIKNLAVAGRCISVAADDMWDVTRVIPPCAVTGEAAGVLAATQDDFCKADVAQIQKILSERGVKLHLSEVGLTV